MSAPVLQPKRRRGINRGQQSTSSRDASEEDNDMTDDAASAVSVPTPHHVPLGHPKAARRNSRPPHTRLLELDDTDISNSEALDSPTYDGDVESRATSTIAHHHVHHSKKPATPSTETVPSSTSSASSESFSLPARLPTPKPSRAVLVPAPAIPQHVLSSDAGPPKMFTRPVWLSEENIRGFVRRAIEGRGEEDGVERDWKTSEPPQDRPVRIYADGVYDLAHLGHALQLRQAKLSFPNVHLIVGVCSDELCAAHKSAPAMTHAERMESIRHFRWTDEVVGEAPWIIDQKWLDDWKIDYVAHDEEVYPTKGVKDVYDFVKRQGKFLPTRRTPSISTSDLLERIVRGYRDGFFDSKLEKNGHPELMASDVDWDSSGSIEKVEARKKRTAAHHPPGHTHLAQQAILPTSTSEGQSTEGQGA